MGSSIVRTSALAVIIGVVQPPPLPAQTLYSPVQGRTVRGEVKSVSRAGLVMEAEGRTGPVLVDRNTRVTVYGRGDPGFVRPGVNVWIEGAIRPGNVVVQADLSVHLNPRATASQQIVSLRSDSDEFNFNGVIVSLNPLVVKMTDWVELEVREGGVGVASPPVEGFAAAVQLKDQNPKDVALILGNSLALAQPGDSISAFYEVKRPNVARWVRVTRKEPLDSKELANAARGGASPKSGKKSAPEQKQE